MYFRSTITGAVYKADFIPKFGGYELSTEAEYIAWCRSHGIDPEK